MKTKTDFSLLNRLGKTNKLLAVILCLTILMTVTGCLNSSSKAVKGNVTGKVYDSNGKVLHNARVEVYGGNHSVLTDELGRYTITNVEPGQKKLVATFEEKSVVKVVEIPRGSTLENADLTFTVIDGLPPVITDVLVQNLTENTAEITWKTNEMADSTLDYATGPIGLSNYTMVASDASLVTDHNIAISNLLPGQTYHFRVRSRDFETNEGVSSDYQFSTPAGAAPIPPLQFVILTPNEMERVYLRWNSNTEADLAGYNLYRSESLTSGFTRINASPIPSTVGSTTYRDEGLKIATKYYYYVKAVDIAGHVRALANFVLATLVTPVLTPEPTLPAPALIAEPTFPRPFPTN
jgi:predicted phage tail protein